jgi:hypothetical protein
MNSQSDKTVLRLDWCSHAAAKYAVEHWHYSRSCPAGKAVHVGVWENGQFVGVVWFARGATGELFSPYDLKNIEGAELVRVALGKHVAPVTRIVSIALKMLRQLCPGLRLVVSFADPYRGHHGGIYQGGGWIYTGMTAQSSMYQDKKGKLWHERMVSKSGVKKCFGRYKNVLKPSDCKRIRLPGKHRYLMPLDADMRKRIMPLAKPYPKRAGSIASDAPLDQSGEGGSTPTPALHSKKSKP